MRPTKSCCRQTGKGVVAKGISQGACSRILSVIPLDILNTRLNRSQLNMLEQMPAFLWGMWLYCVFVDAEFGATLGLMYVGNQHGNLPTPQAALLGPHVPLNISPSHAHTCSYTIIRAFYFPAHPRKLYIAVTAPNCE